MDLIAISVVVAPFLLALVCYPLGRLSIQWRNRAVLTACAINLVLVMVLLVAEIQSGPVSATLFTIAVPGFMLPVGFMISLFSATMMLALAIVFLLLVIYSTHAALPRHHSLYFSLLLMATAGLNGIVASWELVSLYVFWEITSLCFLFLVMIDLEPKATLAGLKLFATSEIAGLILLLGILLTLANFRSSEIAQVAIWLSQDPSGIRGWTVLLFILALAVRGGLVPVHTWMISAVGSARLAVGALLLGAFNLAGLYGMLRLLSPVFLSSASWATVMGIIASVSIIVGSYSALRQRDIRQTIGYHGIAQFGFVALGLSTGHVVGVAAAVGQLLVIALVLPLLLLGFAVLRGERETAESLPIPAGNWPLSMVALAVGGMASAGIPPLLGFGPRWLLFQAGLSEGNWWCALSMLVALFGTAFGIALFIWLALGTLSWRGGDVEQSWLNLTPLVIVSPVLAGIVAVVSVPWILLLRYVVEPITIMVSQVPNPQLLPQGWTGSASFLLVLFGLSVGVVTYLLRTGALVAADGRGVELDRLRPVSDLASPVVDGWWRLADQGRFDLYTVSSSVVLGVARLVSGVFVILTRRIGGW